MGHSPAAHVARTGLGRKPGAGTAAPRSPVEVRSRACCLPGLQGWEAELGT